MKMDSWAHRPLAWLSTADAEQIVVSSRVRLARNLKDRVFPTVGGGRKRRAVWSDVSTTVLNLPPPAPTQSFLLDELTELERSMLFERHLISNEMRKGGEGRGVILSEDEQVGVMVNEEDHLRLQSFQPGLSIRSAWAIVDALDDAIESRLPYAFSPHWGYLTSCPSNVGTGLRASAMLHLPALVLMEEIGPVLNGLSKIGLMVRGLWGEGSEAAGNMFQVSNQITLGRTEERIIDQIEQMVSEIAEHETHARIRLLERKPDRFRDTVGRSYALLMHARVMTSKEAMNLLSGLRLGVEAAMIQGVDNALINELTVLTQPAHLQLTGAQPLSMEDRDRLRAQTMRERLTSAGMELTID